MNFAFWDPFSDIPEDEARISYVFQTSRTSYPAFEKSSKNMITMHEKGSARQKSGG